jgi:hypothetical protein
MLYQSKIPIDLCLNDISEFPRCGLLSRQSAVQETNKLPPCPRYRRLRNKEDFDNPIKIMVAGAPACRTPLESYWFDPAPSRCKDRGLEPTPFDSRSTAHMLFHHQDEPQRPSLEPQFRTSPPWWCHSTASHSSDRRCWTCSPTPAQGHRQGRPWQCLHSWRASERAPWQGHLLLSRELELVSKLELKQEPPKKLRHSLQTRSSRLGVRGTRRSLSRYWCMNHRCIALSSQRVHRRAPEPFRPGKQEPPREERRNKSI